MGVLADFRLILLDVPQIRVEGTPHASSFQFSCGKRGLSLAKNFSVTLFRPDLQNSGNSLIFHRQRRSCPLVVHSADNQKPAELLHASRLGEVTTHDVAETTADTQNGASSPESEDQLFTLTQIQAFRSDPVRARLIKKLSEANQFNRHLLRQVSIREKVIQQSKANISALELELGVLVKVAQEIAKEGGKPGTRKINGRYIHSHLAVRLEECVCALLSQFETWAGDDNLLIESTPLASETAELHQNLLKQLETIEGVRSREVDLVYYGMAENVVVMGSFDNWSHGEAMSPEVTGTFTKFTATLKLLPGRYEIKFLVDGEWKLSNFLPILGESLTMNNLLVVD